MLNTLADKVDPRWTALVVVDMQNDFISPGGAWERTGADVSMGQAALRTLARFIPECRSRGVPVFFIRAIHSSPDNRHLSEAFLHQASKHSSSRFIDVPVCVEGSWGWQLADGLGVKPEDTVIAKHRYSGFLNTDLDARLRGRGVRSLIITGVGTGVCVEATCRHGFELDYYNVILADGCGAYTQAVHDQALQRMGTYYGEVATAAQVIGAWSRANEAVS